MSVAVHPATVRPATVHLLAADGARVAEHVPLAQLVLPFVRETLGPLIHSHVDQSDIRAVPLPVAQESATDADVLPLSGLRYQTEAFAYVYLRVTAAGRMLYRHPHVLSETVDRGLAAWCQEHTGGPQPVAFALGHKGPLATMPAIETMATMGARRPAPAVRGSTVLRPAAGRSARFRIRQVEEPAPAWARRGTFDSAGDFIGNANANAKGGQDQIEAPTGTVRVLVSHDVAALLASTRAFSHELEEGGFLLGRVYRDADRVDIGDDTNRGEAGGAKGGYIAVITDAVVAEHTGASLLHFAFTGDSFAAIKERLHGQADKRLMGWYHTHLFPATPSFGLSSIDVQSHFTTFRMPWQLAGLINIDSTDGDTGSESRVLRFYVRDGDTMVRCPHEIVPAGSQAVIVADADPNTDAGTAPAQHESAQEDA